MKLFAMIVLLVGGAALLAVADEADAWYVRKDGYHAKDSLEAGGPTYNFVDISQSGDVLVVGEDGTATCNSDPVSFDQGWKFPYFGQVKNSFRVNNNGIITFGPIQACNHNLVNQPIPSTGQTEDFVAGFWAHVRGKPVTYDWQGTVGNRHLIVQWTEHDNYYVNCSPIPLWTFQIKLFETGVIEYHLKDVNRVMTGCPTATAASGIEDSTGTKGIAYPLPTNPSGRAIQYWPNRAPTMNAVPAVSTTEDTAKAFTVTGSDPDGDPLTYYVVSQPPNGNVNCVGSTCTYTPNANWNGAETFQLKVKDWWEDGNTVTVNVGATAVNDAPSYTSGTDVIVGQDSGNYEATWATDMAKGGGPDEATQTFSWQISRSNPLLFAEDPELDATGKLSFKPATGKFGESNVEVTLFDSGGTANGGIDYGATTSFKITVTEFIPENEPPVPDDQTVDVNEDSTTPIVLTATDDGPLTYAIATMPAGTLGPLTGSTVDYTPVANFHGTDSLTFEVDDGEFVATGTITIIVLPVNDAPAASDDTITAAANNEKIIPAANLLANDDDIDGDLISISAVAGTSQGGTVTLDGTSVRYTPPTDFIGTDTFTYTISDGDLTSTATVTVAVGDAASSPPTADFTFDFNAPIGTTTVPVAFLDASLEGGGPIVSYQWSIDGQTLTGPDVEYTFLTKGPVAVTLTIVDVNDLSAVVTKSVAIDNDMPVAEITGPSDANVGEAVTFASSSTDDGTLTYAWQIGSATGQGDTFSHTFSSAGTHTVKLTVTDEHGLSHTVDWLVSAASTQPATQNAGGFSNAAPAMRIASPGSTLPAPEPTSEGDVEEEQTTQPVQSSAAPVYAASVETSEAKPIWPYLLAIGAAAAIIAVAAVFYIRKNA